ncbi:glycoside hydrolase family 88/105 protein [Terriglobus aquaticus]|uniref:Glycoside hydrolase family 105 protein n=1 Tax=Terriglobus aquaticus TaxID=940139 RepID=A0ABW9KG27_9BACT|nr:glycoside hydrolase family 88 protein [Terriglobus aquaticus]
MNRMRPFVTVALTAAWIASACAQQTMVGANAAVSAQRDGAAMAATVRQQWPDGVVATQAHPGAWAYETGTLLDGMAAVGLATNDAAERAADLAYVKAAVDRWVRPDGSIETEPGKPFNPSLHTLDNLEPGRAVLFVWQQTHEERYRKAAAFLIAQFAAQPRNYFGGYWHKQVYPDQMWLDGAYMAEPFRAVYAKQFGPASELDDVAKQLLLMDEHMRAPGIPAGELLRHGWDASGAEGKQAQPWADPKTGLSAEVWARALGWYAMALVDTLPSFPANHPDRAKLIAVLQRVMTAVAAEQDAATGVWWDVLHRPGQAGNFREASATAMFVYASAKGVRLGYLPPHFSGNAERGWTGLETQFVTRANGRVTLHGTVKVSGLGGTPYRAGDYSYYVHEAVGDDDPKGVGAFLLAASEVGRLRTVTHSR